MTEILNTEMVKDKQMIDTHHDYMELIYKFVIEPEKESMCPFQHARNEAMKYLKEQLPEYENSKEIDAVWVSYYIRKHMTIESKKTFFRNYGHMKLVMNLNKIAKYYYFDTFENFVDDVNEFNKELQHDYLDGVIPIEKEHEEYVHTLIENDIIEYILINDILKDIIDDYKKVQE